MHDAPGYWAIPTADAVEWIKLDRAIKDARRGHLDVEFVVGCGPLRTHDPVPFRVVGYAAAICANIQLAKRFLGPDASCCLRIFSSSPKTSATGGAADGTLDHHKITQALAGIAGTLDAVGVRECVSHISIDAASPIREVPDAVAGLAAYALKRLPALGHVQTALLRYVKHSSTKVDPFVYGIEHAAPTMFGDLDRRRRLHITVGGDAERTFWAIRRTTAAIADSLEPASSKTEPCAPAMARLMTCVGRTWYAPLAQEPRLEEILRCDLADVANRLSQAAETNSALRYEAKAAKRAAHRCSDAVLRAVAAAVASPVAAQVFLRNGDFEIGPQLTGLWRTT